MKMNRETNNNGWWDAFEASLKADVPDGHLDYHRVKQGLFDKIKQSLSLGELARLKCHDIPQDLDWENFEQTLFKRISQYKEYDEPIDEAIRCEETLPNSQWERLSGKVYDNAESVNHLDEWAAYLKSEQILLPGQWESLESSLDQRLNKLKNDPEWEKIVQADINLGHPVENNLDGKIEDLSHHVENMPEWEQELKSEQLLPQRKWESIEEKLMVKIQHSGNHEKIAQLAPPSLWLTLGWFGNRQVIGSLFAVLFAVFSYFGWISFNKIDSDIPTLVYKLEGNVKQFDNAYYSGSQLASPEGGAMTLVNASGHVHLKNGSQITIEKATKRRIHYKLKSSSSAFNQGIATFYVSKNKNRDNFHVSTPHYDIQVLGTYFHIRPDLNGHFTTQVLEGTIKIITKDGDPLYVTAGERYFYNFESRRYVVVGGGPKINRDQLEQPPKLERLSQYSALKIETEVPNAEIRIDGYYMGLTPFAVLHPPGKHKIEIRHENYQRKDTTIYLQSERSYQLDISLLALKKTVKTKTRHKKKLLVKSPPKSIVEEPSTTMKEVLRRAEILEQTNWKSAVKLYTEVINSAHGTRLEKESAYFAKARVYVGQRKKEYAIKNFLNYLAHYPQGVFAGESWLRLADLELNHNPKKAIEYYQKFFTSYPNHHRTAELQHRVGLIYLQQKRYSQAVAMFEKSLANLLSSQKKLKKNVLAGYHKALIKTGETRKAAHVKSLINN